MTDTPQKIVSGAIVKAEYVVEFHGIRFPCVFDAVGQTFTIYTAHANQSRILSQALNEHKIYGFSVFTDPPASRFEFTDPQEITTLTSMMRARGVGKSGEVSP